MHPIAQMSAFLVSFLSNSSGAMYLIVPRASEVQRVSSTLPETPKSQSLTSSYSWLRSILSVLMSLWTMFMLCRYATVSTILYMNDFAFQRDEIFVFSCLFKYCWRLPPAICSRRISNSCSYSRFLPPCCLVLFKKYIVLTIPGWLSILCISNSLNMFVNSSYASSSLLRTLHCFTTQVMGCRI